MVVPPFYLNPDDTHCQQCCMRMGYEYFQPEKSWEWEELDTLSGKIEGLYAWYMRLYMETKNLGYDVIVYDIVDYPAFAAYAEIYLFANYSEGRAKDILAHSDMAAVTKDARELCARTDIEIHQKSYDFDILRDLLDQGYVLLTMVDDAVIHGLSDRTISHSILIYDYDEQGVVVHNPGVKSLDTAVESQHISYDLFQKACTLNDRGDTGKMMAFKNTGDKKYV